MPAAEGSEVLRRDFEDEFGFELRVQRLHLLQETRRKIPAPKTQLILVTHLLETAIEYVLNLASSFQLIAVVPVPYSIRGAAINSLKNLRIPVYQVNSIDEIAPEILKVCESKPGAKIVQEVGGYCSTIIEKLAAAGVLAIIEDTNQGLWRYQKVKKEIPVYTIADSPLKRLEDKQVGEAVAHSVDTLFRTELHRSIGHQTVGVLGYGGVGRYAAHGLKRIGSQVHVYDIDSIASARAANDGFEVHGRTRLLRSCDALVGVSGSRSLLMDDFQILKPGTILASGSSKQVEFPIEELESTGSIRRVSPYLSEALVYGKAIWILNDGRPVNFIHNSILGNTLDLVYTELFALTVLASEHRADKGLDGIYRMPVDRQREIAAQWCHIYGGKHVNRA